MTNLDLKKTLRHLYAPSSKKVGEVDVPPMNYLMIDGTGNPGTTPQYQRAVEALYSLSYGVRALCKQAGNVFTVMPLEGLWTLQEETAEPFVLTDADKDQFIWTLMILQPEFVTASMVDQAQEQASKKKPSTAVNEVRFECYHEGDAVQIMHIGPYADEGPTVARLHQTIADNGWKLSGIHHEIYLSDPRRVAPEKMKTIIRQPFSR